VRRHGADWLSAAALLPDLLLVLLIEVRWRRPSTPATSVSSPLEQLVFLLQVADVLGGAVEDGELVRTLA